MLRTIKLYGALRKKFGHVFRFDVRSPAEAIAALKATVPGFESHLLAYSEPGYHVFSGKRDLSAHEMNEPDNQTIKIVPVIAGAGGAFKIIVGAILVVVGFFCGGCTTMFGISLIIGGLSEILFAPPKPKTGAERERDANRPSYAFDGPVNTTQQGNAIPVGYGRLIVGGQVLSAGLHVESL